MRYLVIVLLLSACASPDAFMKANTSDAQRSRDFEYCQAKAQGEAPRTGLSTISSFVKACMMDKGYDVK